MVLTEAPSYNSTRVQRAFRINSIEQSRLTSKLQFLEKEKLHAIRVTNQDIRLISLTLDYIQTCSGNSQEGITPSPAPSHGDPSDENEDEDLCFLYGERIASRRAKRFKRPPSGASSSRPASVMGIPSTTRSKRLVRPQSSPQVRFDSTKTTDGTFVTEGPSGRSTPSEAWSEMSSVTRKLIEAQLGTDDRRSVFSTGGRARPERSQSAMSRVLRTEATLASLATDRKLTGAGSRKSSMSSQRGVGISEILNKADIHVMSAQAWKTHLQNKKGSVPATYAQQQQDILGHKKTINNDRKMNTNVKINNFISRFPTSRSVLPD